MKKKPTFLSANFDVGDLPDLDLNDVRKYCCGWYPINLSQRYLQYSREKGGMRLMVTRSRHVRNGWVLIRVRGISSRFRNSKKRTVEILFSKDSIEDTRCTCPGGLRNTGCAHAIAVLRYIVEEQSGQPTTKKTMSEEMADLIDIPTEYISDDESEEEEEESD